jgi:hypothetical protein
MDNKPVHLLSTFRTFLSSCSRVVKKAKRYAGQIALSIPSVIKVYNKMMGGTDSFDQRMKYYKTRVRGKKWQTRIFTHFLEVCAVNACILYREDIDPNITQLKFNSLLIEAMGVPHLKQTGRPSKYHSHQSVEEKRVSRHTGRHCPYVLRRRVLGDDGSQDNTGRLRCRVCQQKGIDKKVQTGCSTCFVGLCMRNEVHDDNPSCFDLYHDETCTEIED